MKNRRPLRRPSHKPRPVPGLEPLECRQLLSAAVMQVPMGLNGPLLSGSALQAEAPGTMNPTYQRLLNSATLMPLQTSGPEGYTPQQIATAYGYNQISFGGVTGDGTGQTIAIIDAYNDPTIKTDLTNFDAKFGLAAPPSFQVLSQSGTTKLPNADPAGAGNDNWEGEEALDVEWAHALAPGASIMLVEANNDSPGNLFAAVKWARTAPDVSVVSMSFGGDELSSELSYDPDFTTPSGHTGVTFVASTGDDAAPAGYPAYSPNVVAAGGTRLITSGTAGTYQSETGWTDSGGGISEYEAQPAYQSGVVTQTYLSRTAPDISFDADPDTGVAVYDSYNNGTATPWEVLGGTSVAAPCLSAMFAIANQGRVLAGENTLDSRTNTLPLLYSAPASDFHDITSGKNGYSSKPGYDLVTGLGSPQANALVPYLVTGIITAPTGSNPTVAALAASAGNIVSGTQLTLTVQSINDPGGTGLTVTFYEETNGTAGLQTGPGGDLVLGAATSSSDAITIPANNLSLGSYTFYVQVTDAQGGATPSGINAISAAVNVVSQITTGPIIGQFTSEPNPVLEGEPLVLAASDLSDGIAGAQIRRVYFYAETNDTPGLQTGGFTGDFPYGSVNVQNGVATLTLDTTGVDPGQYTFYAQALDTAGKKSASGTAAATAVVTIAAPNPPKTPTALKAQVPQGPDSSSEIDLTFTENDTIQSGFTIERSNNAQFTSFTTLFTVDKPFATTYSDTGLAGGTTYYYRVAAFDLAGTSNFSQVASATTSVGATHLVFLQPPKNVAAGQTFAQPITVAVEDAKGNIMTGDDSTVGISLSSFPAGATLSGTLYVDVINGVATFSDLSLAKAGKYTLTATDGALKAAKSSTFTVSADASTAHLVITQQPAAVLVGASQGTLVVEREDPFGNLVAGTGKIHLTLTNGPANGSVSGATVVSATSGIATFKNLKYTAAGNYVFAITDDSLPGATPLDFTEQVNPGTSGIKPVNASLFYPAGKTITLSTQMISTAPTSVPFTGTAEILNQNQVPLATGTVQKNGSVSFAIANLTEATYSCTVAYMGDANHTAATSSGFVLLITAAAATRR